MFWSWMRSRGDVSVPPPPCVDDRTFLIGLDYMVRQATRNAERAELCRCAERVVAALDLAPGSSHHDRHADEPKLARYHTLLRCLHAADERLRPRVASMPEFQRLVDVSSSGLFGETFHFDRLLPEGQDALCSAMQSRPPRHWTLSRLLGLAKKAAVKWDDISPLGLACRIADPFSIIALRDASLQHGGFVFGTSAKRNCSWQVNEEIAFQARRTVAITNELFGCRIPAPERQHATTYYCAARENRAPVRCIHLGFDPKTERHYHWALTPTGEIREFWTFEPWTTHRYRAAHRL